MQPGKTMEGEGDRTRPSKCSVCAADESLAESRASGKCQKPFLLGERARAWQRETSIVRLIVTVSLLWRQLSKLREVMSGDQCRGPVTLAMNHPVRYGSV